MVAARTKATLSSVSSGDGADRQLAGHDAPEGGRIAKAEGHQVGLERGRIGGGSGVDHYSVVDDPQQRIVGMEVDPSLSGLSVGLIEGPAVRSRP